MNHAFGERHGNAKLREQDAREVRDLALGGVLSLRQIGKIFGVHYTTVADIKMRRTWSHVGDDGSLMARPSTEATTEN
jgi:transposase